MLLKTTEGKLFIYSNINIYSIFKTFPFYPCHSRNTKKVKLIA